MLEKITPIIAILFLIIVIQIGKSRETAFQAGYNAGYKGAQSGYVKVLRSYIRNKYSNMTSLEVYQKTDTSDTSDS